MKTVQSLLIVAAVLCWSASVYAQSVAYPFGISEQERLLQEAKAAEQPFPLGVSGGLSQTIGGGTFTKDPYVRRASVDLSMSISPYWRITPLMRLSAGVGVSTTIVENYGSGNTQPHQWYVSDTSLSFSHAQIYKIPVVGIGISGGVSLGFPSSLQSQYRTLLMSARGNLGFSRALGPVYLSYGFGFFKNLNRYTSPVLDKDRVGDKVILSHYLGNEQLTTDLVAVGGLNTSFGLSNSLMVSWNIIDQLSLAVYYSLTHGWTYGSYKKDELSSEYADAGKGRRDSQTGVIDLSYSFNKYVSASLGIQTSTAPKTADNKAIIFPFANFSDNWRNNTGIYLSVGARY
ncbi:MAG: hypothetical protein ABIK09_16725 [Pseudomonadota bacterium]